MDGAEVLMHCMTRCGCSDSEEAKRPDTGARSMEQWSMQSVMYLMNLQVQLNAT